MGAIYGQRTRILLNHDTVFLAELLLSIAPAAETSRAYRSFSCLEMPKRSEIPLALQFAAAATIVLAHFRIADHYLDSKQARWRAVKRLLSPSYRQAAATLRAWDFPMDELTAILASQSERELNAQSVNHVAEPTAVATGLFLAHGARVVGRGEKAQRLYAIGHRFGSLIYTLDAYEDREKDAKRGEFNALLHFKEVDGRQEILETARTLELELPPELAIRLRINVEERLGLRPRVFHECRAGIGERWRKAVGFAKAMRERERAGAVRGVLILTTTAAVAFAVPHYARMAESWRHCMGLGLNLMALGTVFAASPIIPPTVPKPPSGKSPGSQGSFCCNGDSCDGCDCPCDGCDSCDCS